jgi:hypothetical protein
MNLAALGLTDKSDETCALIIDIGALVVYALRENPETRDEELDEIAVYGLQTFHGDAARAAPP